MKPPAPRFAAPSFTRQFWQKGKNIGSIEPLHPDGQRPRNETCGERPGLGFGGQVISRGASSPRITRRGQ
jgi:hypothetical protein